MKQKTLIEIDEILFEYDGPYLFTGTDEQNNKYLNIQCNIDKNIVYLSVPISRQEIFDIKLASKSVDSIFLKDNTTIYKGDFVKYCDELESFPYTLDEELKKTFFDGTFYLNPEDYEDDLCSLDYKFIWVARESLNTEQIKLNICSSILKNHPNNQWVKEDLVVTRVERIPSQVYSPGISRYFGMKKSQKEIKFSCSDLYTKETQQIDYDYNNAA